MKLSKLYANMETFKPIEFNDGVNVIIGKVENNIKKNTDNTGMSSEPNNSDRHNLGKSLIIEIIDYVLCKQYRKGNLTFDGEQFYNYVFFLEIQLNSGKFLTLKRALHPKLRNKISIKKHNIKHQNFVDESIWDFDNIGITGTSLNKEYGVEVLQKLLGFDIIPHTKYRKFLGYLLRTQDDYVDPFQLKKNLRGKDIEWKPMIFKFIGYTESNLKQLYEITSEISEIENKINEFKRNNKNLMKKTTNFQEELTRIENEINEFQTLADNFDFYTGEKEITEKLIFDIESKIESVNLSRYKINRQLASISKAMKVSITYNYDEVFSMFEEMKVIFPDAVKKNFEELLSFNEAITTERMSALNALKEKLGGDLDTIETDLRKLNSERSKLANDIFTTSTVRKYKEIQEYIVKLKMEHHALKEKMQEIKDLVSLENDKKDKEDTLENQKMILSQEIEKKPERAIKFEELLSNIVEVITGSEASIKLKSASTGNIEFNISFINSDGNINKKSRGHTYRKELCVSLDLAILSTYIKSSFFRFAFHDGVLDGDDPKIAASYIKLIRQKAVEGIQTIVTALDTITPQNNENPSYSFKENEVVLELYDDPEGIGTLFGFKF